MSPKVTPPSCADCGASKPHVVSYPAKDGEWSHVWICGSCEVKRANLEAKPRVLMPSERRVPKQRETLFDPAETPSENG